MTVVRARLSLSVHTPNCLSASPRHPPGPSQSLTRVVTFAGGRTWPRYTAPQLGAVSRLSRPRPLGPDRPPRILDEIGHEPHGVAHEAHSVELEAPRLARRDQLRWAARRVLS
eukprot:5096025-Prymnesium_polylepis.1